MKYFEDEINGRIYLLLLVYLNCSRKLRWRGRVGVQGKSFDVEVYRDSCVPTVSLLPGDRAREYEDAITSAKLTGIKTLY